MIIDKSIKSAMAGTPRSPVVDLKVRRRTLERYRPTEIPDVRNEIVRIVNDCDPIGFLADVVNGKAIECHIISEDGTIHTIYETPSLTKRIEVAKYLADKYMPKVAVVKHAHLHKMEQKTESNFDQMVTHAARSADASDSED